MQTVDGIGMGSEVSAVDIVAALGSFLWIFLASLAIGAAFGFGSAVLFRPGELWDDSDPVQVQRPPEAR